MNGRLIKSKQSTQFPPISPIHKLSPHLLPASAAATASLGDKTPLMMIGSGVTERSQGKSLAKLLLRSRSAREGWREGRGSGGVVNENHK